MKTVLSVLAAFAFPLPLVSEETPSRELLRDGLFEEEVNQDLAKAEAAYRSVVRRYDEERYFAGLALFRLAEINRKTNKEEDAVALYRRVALEFPDQKELAKRAIGKLGEAGIGLDSATAFNTPAIARSKEESLELQRLEKIKRDSPDLLNGVGEDGWHPLHKAAASGWTTVVDYLLAQKVSVDPRTSTETEYRSNGYTPLQLAVIHGHLSVVDQLLGAGADPGLSISIKPQDLPLPVQSISLPMAFEGDWNAMHLAILYQRRGIVRRLLNSEIPVTSSGPTLANYIITSVGPSGNTQSNTFKFGATPLMLAIWLNDQLSFETLVEAGADLNQAASKEGETPLLAAIWKNEGLVPTLIERGARVNDNFIFGRSPLHWALQRCNPPTITELVEAGANVNIRVERNQNRYEENPSPLEISLRWDLSPEQREAVCKALLDAGAKPTTRVLISATAYSLLDTMKALVAAKVDPNGGNSDGDRPLHYAKNVEAAKILVEAGADLDVKNHKGITPLGRILDLPDTPDTRALIDFLLDQGADPSPVSNFLFSVNEEFGNLPLLPYVMSKTRLPGASDPRKIRIAFPKNWSVIDGAHQLIPGTPPPSLNELVCLNFATLSSDRSMPATRNSSRSSIKSSSRSSNPLVVTDLIIYRPDGNGRLKEVAQLADQGKRQHPAPALQWGDIVLFRSGLKQDEKLQMPLVHFANGLPQRTVTFKVGSWENQVRIENTHQIFPGLDLQEHFDASIKRIDLTKIILRRAGGGSKILNLTPQRDLGKVMLRDGDVIEYSLLPQVHHEAVDSHSFESTIMFFYPDRPYRSSITGTGAAIPLADLLHNLAFLDGRDFSKAIIQRMGKERLEQIPLDLVAVARSLTEGEEAISKAVDFLKTTIHPGDILILPPENNLSWRQLNSFVSIENHPDLRALLKLVAPTPPPASRRPPVTTKPTQTTNSAPSRVRRVPVPPSR